MARYGMVIDLRNCVACHACSVACKSNNNLPNGVWRNRVYTDGGEYMDTARGTYPNDLYRVHYPISCQHCSDPACAKVCPTGATSVRNDGIVVVDSDTCIGCQACMSVCPYEARVLLPSEDELAYVVDFPLGDVDAPEHRANTVEKCDFCVHRLDRGEVPACMELCPGRARFWGDLDDPESDASRALQGREFEQLYTEANTSPNCYYLK